MASPQVGVRGHHRDPARVGPVIVQAFPDAFRAFSDVGVAGALVVHLEVAVGAVGEDLRAARPEVGERGEELLRCRGGRLVKVNGGHGGLLDWGLWSLPPSRTPWAGCTSEDAGVVTGADGPDTQPPPRAWARVAERSSSAATSSACPRVARARCQARRP